MDKLEITKKVVGGVSGVGASMIVGSITHSIAKTSPNPVIRVVAWLGAVGIGMGVSKFAERSMSDFIDDLYEVIRG